MSSQTLKSGEPAYKTIRELLDKALELILDKKVREVSFRPTVKLSKGDVENIEQYDRRSMLKGKDGCRRARLRVVPQGRVGRLSRV